MQKYFIFYETLSNFAAFKIINKQNKKTFIDKKELKHLI